MEQINEMIVTYGSKLVSALIVLVVGWFLIGIIMGLAKKSMEKGNVEKSLRSFLSSTMNIGLKILLFITVASTLGVAMTSFVAVLGAAGLAVSLALQGSLSNFAGGVLILLFKPFKVGDFIEAQGYKGVVKDIQVLYTVLDTPDNRRVVIPNGNLSNNSVMNYTINGTRRVDLAFGVGYDDDVDKVREILMRLASSHAKALKDPAPFVRLSEHGDSSINFTVRIWCNGADYWDVYFDMMENVKKEFDKEGVNIPYPQMDVHVKKED